MFGVGLPELAVIFIVGVMVAGPNRLPEFARQAGRMARQLRQLARNAQNDLRHELGPEFADLNLRDLDPRVAIRKHILEGMAEEPRPGTPTDLPVLQEGERPPFDVEAT